MLSVEYGPSLGTKDAISACKQPATIRICHYCSLLIVIIINKNMHDINLNLLLAIYQVCTVKCAYPV